MIENLLLIGAISLRILSNPLSNVFQKQLTSKNIHPLFVNFITYFVLSIVCVFVVDFEKLISLSDEFWIYSIIGGLLGALGNGFLVKALQHGELSVLGPINSYKSVISIFFGVFLLKEIPNFWGIIGIILIIFGSYYVLETTEEKFSLKLLQKKEIQFRIWAMLFTAIEAVVDKRIILLSSTEIAFISWAWFGAIFSFILLPINKVNLKSELKLIKPTISVKYLMLCFSAGIMQLTTNYTFKHIPVGYALSLFQLSTLVSILLGYKLFNEKSILKKIIGSCIMILGSILIILFKNS